jgi:hypothetical protein
MDTRRIRQDGKGPNSNPNSDQPARSRQFDLWRFVEICGHPLFSKFCGFNNFLLTLFPGAQLEISEEVEENDITAQQVRSG